MYKRILKTVVSLGMLFLLLLTIIRLDSLPSAPPAELTSGVLAKLSLSESEEDRINAFEKVKVEKVKSMNEIILEGNKSVKLQNIGIHSVAEGSEDYLRREKILTDYMTETLTGTDIYLEKFENSENPAGNNGSVYQVWISKPANRLTEATLKNFNVILVRDGYSEYVPSVRPNLYATIFAEAERIARNKRRNVWSQ